MESHFVFCNMDISDVIENKRCIYMGNAQVRHFLGAIFRTFCPLYSVKTG